MRPTHGDCAIATSPVWFADPDGTWVGTLSRYYQLGPPLHRDDVQRIVMRMDSNAAAGGSPEDGS